MMTFLGNKELLRDLFHHHLVNLCGIYVSQMTTDMFRLS